jgi:hypothetical protein
MVNSRIEEEISDAIQNKGPYKPSLTISVDDTTNNTDNKKGEFCAQSHKSGSSDERKRSAGFRRNLLDDDHCDKKPDFRKS